MILKGVTSRMESKSVELLDLLEELEICIYSLWAEGMRGDGKSRLRKGKRLRKKI